MILRLDPDIIFVGEIRDAETARIAIQASLTGHLVISTIHSRNSIGALYRLKDLGVETYMINYALRAIVAQRLLRRVCDQCKEIYTPTAEETAFYVKEKGQAPSNLMHGRGCENCHTTRYKGRAGIFELLEMDDDVRGLVAQGVNESVFRENMKSKGFLDMSHEGLALVDSGTTSLREYIRTINDAK
jgi:type II secretory ATPase GspE/PulE/Tfp pilus assembly ATPase PilB-like protein